MSSKEAGDVEEEELTPEEEIQKLRFMLKESQDEAAELKLQVSEKNSQIAGMREARSSLVTQQKEEVALLLEEIKSLKEEREHDEVLLVEEINRLKQDNAHVGDVEEENRRLRERVAELLGELEKRGRNFA